jgi:hypothetical protein
MKKAFSLNGKDMRIPLLDDGGELPEVSENTLPYTSRFKTVQRDPEQPDIYLGDNARHINNPNGAQVSSDTDPGRPQIAPMFVKMRDENTSGMQADISNPERSQIIPASTLGRVGNGEPVEVSQNKLPAFITDSPRYREDMLRNISNSDPAEQAHLAKRNDQADQKLDQAVAAGNLPEQGKALIAKRIIGAHEANIPSNLSAPQRIPRITGTSEAAATAVPEAPSPLGIAYTPTTPPDLIQSTSNRPQYTGPGKAVPAGQLIPEMQLGKDENTYQKYGADREYNNEYKQKQADLDKRIDAANKKATDENLTPGENAAAQTMADRLTRQREELKRPGATSILGKIGRGFEQAGDMALQSVAPEVSAMIPGSNLSKQQAKEATLGRIKNDVGQEKELSDVSKDLAQAKALGEDVKTTSALLEKGYAKHVDANGNVTLEQIPGYRDAPKSNQEALASATQDALAAGRHPADDPKVQDIIKVIQLSEKQPTEHEPTNADILAAGGAAYQENGKWLQNGTAYPSKQAAEQALGDKIYKQRLAQDKAKSVQITIPQAAAEGQNKATAKEKGTTYTYTDENGQVQMATGDKVPEGVDKTAVKDPQAVVTEGRSANIVQQSLNRVTQDVTEHPEMFDNNTTRDVITESTAEIDRAAALGVSVPASIMEKINIRSQNSISNVHDREHVQQYIADYKAMKDKALVMQMEMQGGKMGRGSAAAFQSIISQIPGPGTASSKQALRQLEDLQQTQNELMKKYPEKYGNYTKTHPWAAKGNVASSAPRSTDTLPSAGSSASGYKEGAVMKDNDGKVVRTVRNGKWQ